jgi:hypothetical protein
VQSREEKVENGLIFILEGQDDVNNNRTKYQFFGTLPIDLTQRPKLMNQAW